MSGDYPKMDGQPPATTPGAASDIATARVGQKRDAEKGWSLNIIFSRTYPAWVQRMYQQT